jgi:hypothetical protein
MRQPGDLSGEAMMAEVLMVVAGTGVLAALICLVSRL